ncbi:MAG: hypothetical protein ACK55Z_26120, partial [bacterium]
RKRHQAQRADSEDIGTAGIRKADPARRSEHSTGRCKAVDAGESSGVLRSPRLSKAARDGHPRQRG